MGKLKEGYCIKISSLVPVETFKITNENLFPKNGKKINWVICLDNERNKDFLLISLIKLKLENQHLKGLIVDYSNYYNKTNISGQNSKLDKLKVRLKNFLNIKDGSIDKIEKNSREENFRHLNNNDNNSKSSLPNEKDVRFILKDSLKKYNLISSDSIDGYWVVMKEWSECTLKCDGGKQYQRLLCIPPKNNGKPCQGDPVNIRPCNVNPCPKEISLDFFFSNSTYENNILNFSDVVSDSKENKYFEEEIILKYLPLINRPLEYDKCKLKESDALWLNDEFNNDYYSNSPKVPVRMIMNEFAISIFTDEVIKLL